MLIGCEFQFELNETDLLQISLRFVDDTYLMNWDNLSVSIAIFEVVCLLT